MPLPDERHGKSVASLIGRFEQQTKKQISSPPGPRSSSVASHTTGDSTKEEAKEKREWPPRSSNVTSPPSDSEVGKREWAPRLSAQNSGDSSGQRWPPVQPIIQASPFSELKKSPTSPLAKGSELATPEVEAPPSPPAETPKVIEIVPPSRESTLVGSEPPELDPPEPVEPEPSENPKTPPQPTTTSPTTKPGPSSVATKAPQKTIKATPTKPNAKTTNKPPPSSFTKGSSLHAEVNDRRTSTSAQPPSRPTSRTNLRSKTPTSTPVRPPSSAQRKPATETPRQPVKRPKTPATSPRQPPTTPNKPPPVIPKTPNSRLYAPTAASLAKSTNSPQPPPPERKKTLSSGASLERLSKPTASSLSKSRSANSLASTTSPPKAKPTPTRTGTLNNARKSAATSKTKPANSTPVKTSAKGDGDTQGGSHENGNGLGVGVPTDEEGSHPEVEPSDAEHHELEYPENGSPEVSYTEEPSEAVDEAHAHGPGEAVHQHCVEDLEEFVRSHSPESCEHILGPHVEDDATSEPTHESSAGATGGLNQEPANDDIADIVGLLESTGFTSKHILQGSDDSVANGSNISGLEKEGQKIGEIPDE